MPLWDDLFIEDIDYDAYVDGLGVLLEAKGRPLDEAGWIALVAHYLDLREIHEKSKSRAKADRPKGIIKDPITITDPETGEAERRPSIDRRTGRRTGKVRTELDPEGFAEWRGMDPKLFTKMLDKYERTAERFRKTTEHRRTLKKIMRPKAEWSWEKHKPGRRLDPKKVFERVKLVAAYLDAKEADRKVTITAFAKANGVSQAYFNTQVNRYTPEANAYRHLTKAGEDVGEPESRKKLATGARKDYSASKEKEWSKRVVELGRAIKLGSLEAKSERAVIDDYANKTGNTSAVIKTWWDRLKDKHEIKVAIAKSIGATAPEKAPRKKPGRVAKPKPLKPTLFRGRGSYRPKRKGDEEIDAWVNLAHDVEQEGQVTDAMAMRHADMVGVKVIRAVKSFPEKWGDKQISKWMGGERDRVVREAKPKLEAKLKELGLWNPKKMRAAPKVGPTKLGPQTAEKVREPWRDLEGWTANRMPIVAIVAGSESPKRNLQAHKWVYDYFDVRELWNRNVQTIANFKPDLVIILSRFVKHMIPEIVRSNISSNTPVVDKVGGSPIGGMGSAIASMKATKTASWFVDAHNKEKGIQESVEQIIYNLLQGHSLEQYIK